METATAPIFLKDNYGRAIRDLRVSITDRCNFRCFYCMPQEAMEWKPKPEILTYEEIVRVDEVFVGLGIDKLRVTGDEPMLRRELESLIERVAKIEGVGDWAMTTNAHFLRGRAKSLKDAGLERITVSLDSLTPDRFALLTGRNELPQVLDGIDAAIEAGLHPVKINCVAIRGINDDQAIRFAEFAHPTPPTVPFFQFIPLAH